MEIFIFGDSITYGAWDVEGGWVARLRRHLDEITIPSNDDQQNYMVYNCGVSGDNSNDLVARFEFELKNRRDEEDEQAILFAIGTNDSQLLDGKDKVSVKEYITNIKALWELARKYTSKVAFIGLTPVDETNTNPRPHDKSRAYTNARVMNYNNELKNFCKANSVDFIDPFKSLSIQKDLNDGLHPNSEGHKKIFGLVKSYLLEHKIISQ